MGTARFRPISLVETETLGQGISATLLACEGGCDSGSCVNDCHDSCHSGCHCHDDCM